MTKLKKILITIGITIFGLTLASFVKADSPNYWIPRTSNGVTDIHPLQNSWQVQIGTTTPTTATLELQGSGSKNALEITSSTGSSLLTVLANGNVGINSTSPNSLLTLKGSGTGTANDFMFTDSNNKPLVVMEGNERVGVGTTTPTTTFALQGAAGVDLFDIASSTGTSLFHISQNGNVGIGTTGPTNKLQVIGGSNTASISVGIDTSVSYGGMYYNSTDDLLNIFTQANGKPIRFDGLSVKFRTGAVTIDTTLAIGGATIGSNALAVTGSAIISGNVGIGTTTPNQLLTVYGNLSIATSSTPALFVNTATTQVGIGTANPGNQLVVNNSSGNSKLQVSAAGSAYLVLSSNNATPDWNLLSDATTGNLDFYNNGVVNNRMVIQQNGNVGIGTSTPNATLHDYGSFARKYTTTNASTYTIATTTDNVIYAASSTAAQTLNLPDCNGTTDQIQYTIKDSSGAGATKNKTISGTNSRLIDGASSKVLNSNFGVASVQCSTSASSTPEWFILNN